MLTPETLAYFRCPLDPSAAFVKDGPVRPADVVASVYHCLGIDPDMPVYDRSMRPVAAAQGGEPVREILA